MKEEISEANYSESLGAIIALGWILPDDHPASGELVQWLISCPVRYQQEIFAAWNALDFRMFHSRVSNRLSAWVRAALITIANSGQWNQLNRPGKKDLCSLLFTEEKYMVRACAMAGLDAKLASLIATVCDKAIWEDDVDSKKYHFGPVGATLWRHNWTTGTLPAQVTQALSRCTEVPESGLFQIVVALLRFSQKMDFYELHEILKLLPEGQESLLDAIPPWLVGLLPCCGPHSLKEFDLAHLRAMNAADLNQLITKRDLDRWPPYSEGLFVENRGQIDSADWERLFEYLPSIGANILLMDERQIFGISEVDVKQHFHFVKKALLNSPVLAKRHFLSWGRLFENDISGFQQLREVVGRTGCTGTDLVFGRREIQPFLVDIEDGYSLCLLAKGIVESFHYSHDREWSETVQSLSKAIRSFNLTAGELATAAADVRQNPNTKAACHLLSIMCADDVTVRSRLISALQDIPLIQNLIDEEPAGWYANGLCNLMERELGEQVPGAVAAAVVLLVSARDRVELRQALSRMLAVWREASSSPVHATQSLQKWLDE